MKDAARPLVMNGSQAASAAFFANRRRAIRPAAAAPNRIIIGGAGTGDGLPLLLPWCPPFDDQ